MVRSLYAPMLAGGTTICCASFDPSLFWDVVEKWSPTWYYATPTMHQMILAESEHRPDALRQSLIKFIINAGGGLPATLAVQLREVFQCVVMPSYGMTECAPIASPPTDYKLDREGTSGRPCGPDVAILGDSPGKRVPTGTTGRICVRGFPVFPGYLTDGGINKGAFEEAGWFDTGDLGHLDKDGYLFITGRGKEVINRGGEIISPIEVENGILSAARDPTSILYGRVSEALAFSTPHDVLQEVVGAVIVTPPGMSRPDLRQLHEALGERLLQPKWPVLLVYMDNGVPKSNNKLQRIRLSQRLGLEPLTDSVPAAERHLEAKCPPQGTGLNVSIAHTMCRIDGHEAEPHIEEALGISDIAMRFNHIDGYPQAVVYNPVEKQLTLATLAQLLRPRVHGYLIPSSVKALDSPIPRDAAGYVDDKALDDAIRSMNASDSDSSSAEYRVRQLFAQALNQDVAEISASTDFFAAGGDSLSAGRLISALRREFGIRLSGDVLFLHSTVGDMTAIVEDACAKKNPDEEISDKDLPGCEKTCSSTNPIVLLIQLIPMIIFFPMRAGLQWTIFVFLMGETARLFPPDSVLIGRLLHIVLIGLASRLAINAVAPVGAILFKWLLVGRYRAGLYPMWGTYHTRWWLTQKAIRVAGRVCFSLPSKYTTNIHRVCSTTSNGVDVCTIASWERISAATCASTSMPPWASTT
jgi:acyl carrier protein